MPAAEGKETRASIIFPLDSLKEEKDTKNSYFSTNLDCKTNASVIMLPKSRLIIKEHIMLSQKRDPMRNVFHLVG